LLTRIEYNIVRNSQCYSAVSMVVATIAGDVSFGIGAYRAAAFGLKAIGQGIAARSFAQDPMLRQYTVDHIIASQGYLNVGATDMAYAGLEYVPGTAWANTVSASQGSGVGWRDWVPGFASVQAYNRALAAC
jgi:hypothetical protein